MTTGVYSRFQVLNLAAAVSVLTERKHADACISIQIRDPRKNTYNIYQIIQIIESVDKNGDRLLFYRRDDQKIYVDGTNLPGTLQAPSYLLWRKSPRIKRFRVNDTINQSLISKIDI